MYSCWRSVDIREHILCLAKALNVNTEPRNLVSDLLLARRSLGLEQPVPLMPRSWGKTIQTESSSSRNSCITSLHKWGVRWHRIFHTIQLTGSLTNCVFTALFWLVVNASHCPLLLAAKNRSACPSYCEATNLLQSAAVTVLAEYWYKSIHRQRVLTHMAS